MAFDGEQTKPRSDAGAHAGAAPLNLGLGRRSDLDWLRVIAFGLLILFHASLVYAPFDWHIHSRHTEGWLREGILLTGPWRLTLLFFISGAALKLMSRKLTAAQVLKTRLARLVPPALFGILVLVPPQAFIEAVDKGSWHEGFFAWWASEFSPSGLAAGVPVNHLWFVLYILVYSVLATALIASPKLQTALSSALGKSLTALSGFALLLAPVLYLTLARQGLFLRFGISNHLSSDWYNHAVSLGAFLMGFLVVGQSEFWRAAIRWRWPALAGAITSLTALMILNATPANAPEPWFTSLVFSADQWTTIAAILGFGALHLQNRDGPLLRYLTQAVFPCYLAHQTILVCAVWVVRPLNLPAFAEAPLLVTVTIGGCFAVYEGVRRINLIRPLWGLKPIPRRTAAVAAAPRPFPARKDSSALTAEAA